MTHREFNNLSARRNLSSFIPARNQTIRLPRTSARVYFSTNNPISRTLDNKNLNVEYRIPVDQIIENYLESVGSITQGFSSERDIQTINLISDRRKEIILNDFYYDLINNNLERFSENIYIKKNVFGNHIYIVSFKHNSIDKALIHDKDSYSKLFKNIKPIYNIFDYFTTSCKDKILELEKILSEGNICFIGILDIINLSSANEEQEDLNFQYLFDLDCDIRNLENSILYDNRD